MAFGEQIVLVGLEMRPVRDRRLSGSPESRQLELGVQVDEIRGGAAQVRDVDVPLVDKAQLVGRHGTVEVPRGLRRSETAPVGEGRQYIAIRGVLDLRVQARGQPKMSMP